ncbi:uncharacterized protein TM35_000142660 [Trypanosoma theileri]|uniref:Uncharacterized protein n=1 Tax=Trypanosoma theileri TaxID=67003 RepID=A0A1X0NWI1_9TRYP|nr:uncharacterized protein TM35_000142660 [Trypanosoma theileri]ORC89055.1 hypothetical protein TM35_000142660 [Trypanosoma theileri]
MRRWYCEYSWFWFSNSAFRAVSALPKSSQRRKGNSDSSKKRSSNTLKEMETTSEVINITAKENQQNCGSQKLDIFRFTTPIAAPVNELSRKVPKYIPRKKQPYNNSNSDLQGRGQNKYNKYNKYNKSSSSSAAATEEKKEKEGPAPRSQYHHTTHRASASKNSTSSVVRPYHSPTEQKRNEDRPPGLAGLRVVRLN